MAVAKQPGLPMCAVDGVATCSGNPEVKSFSNSGAPEVGGRIDDVQFELTVAGCLQHVANCSR